MYPKCYSENPATRSLCGDCGTQLKPIKEVLVQTKTIQVPNEELTIGSTFANKYQIIEEVGKGWMGKFLKAQFK